MSSNKRMCLRSDSKLRQSFDERVCDDLCGLILQFLPQKERLRLRCVSKQFQRTVCESFVELTVDFPEVNWLKKLKHLLKKFHNIRRIYGLNLYSINNEDNKIAIHLIHKYCSYLTHFQFPNDYCLEDRHYQRFVDKFGSSLVNLDLYQCHNPRKLLSLMKNTTIRELSMLVFYFELSFIRFNNLEAFNVTLCEDDVDEFEIFAERNRNIKFLTIFCYPFKSKKTMITLLATITRFTKLVELDIQSPDNVFCEKLFATHFKQIAILCKQIKRVSLCFSISELNRTSHKELLSTLKHFKSMTDLRLKLIVFENEDEYDDTDSEEDEFDINPFDYELADFDDIELPAEQFWKEKEDILSIQLFKGFEQLTHLVLKTKECYHTFSEKLLTDIDVNLPKLQSLDIDWRLSATEWTADILSRLSRLSQIKLKIEEKSMESHIEDKLREKCSKLTQISFYK